MLNMATKHITALCDHSPPVRDSLYMLNMATKHITALCDHFPPLWGILSDWIQAIQHKSRRWISKSS